MNLIFHDLVDVIMEVYIDDTMIKSDAHTSHLAKIYLIDHKRRFIVIFKFVQENYSLMIKDIPSKLYISSKEKTIIVVLTQEGKNKEYFYPMEAFSSLLVVVHQSLMLTSRYIEGLLKTSYYTIQDLIKQEYTWENFMKIHHLSYLSKRRLGIIRGCGMSLGLDGDVSIQISSLDHHIGTSIIGQTHYSKWAPKKEGDILLIDLLSTTQNFEYEVLKEYWTSVFLALKALNIGQKILFQLKRKMISAVRRHLEDGFCHTWEIWVCMHVISLQIVSP
ncbi:hypothetical protein ACJX0J_031465, partial [Zea mays]